MKRSTAASITIALAILISACSSPLKSFSSKFVPADAKLLSQIGLPLYPGAKTDAYATIVHMTIGSMPVVTTEAQLRTSDALSKVEAWYAGRLPTARRMPEFHFGNAGAAAFQVVDDRGTAREVELIGAGVETEVQLSLTTMQVVSPSPAVTRTPPRETRSPIPSARAR